MTFADFLAKFSKEPASIIAVVYGNYRVIGDVEDITRAVGNYKKHNDVDLMDKNVGYHFRGSAYGSEPATAVCYLDDEAVAETPTPDA